MGHELFEIWAFPNGGKFKWRAQLINFIGHFATQEKAQNFVDAVKEYRKRNNLDAPAPVRKTK